MDFFGVGRVPYMARRNYLIEIRHLLMWGVFAGTFEGSVSSVVAAKTFHADWFLITLVMSTPMVANLMGLLWGRIAAGRRKRPLFMVFALATALMIGSIALAPAGPAGGWVFVAQILLARMMLSGCLTVRAGLWKHNYPQVFRGRIAARLQLVRFSMGIATVTAVSLLFDMDPLIYTMIYPVAAAVGMISVLALRPMHVRGERLELRRAAETAAGVAAADRDGLLASMIRVLRGDRAFARYCLAMMLIGSANMMIMPVLTIIVTRQLYLSYFHSCNLLEVLPRALMMGSLMPWAALFDRVGAVRFRCVNGAVWASATVFGGIGAAVLEYAGVDSAVGFPVMLAAIALATLTQGLGRGGGAIAWNLGHLHFAEPDKTDIYMGIHVTLAGLRGLAAPFMGTALYAWFGWPAFGVAFVFALSGVMVFRSLARAERRTGGCDRATTADAALPAGPGRTGSACTAANGEVR